MVFTGQTSAFLILWEVCLDQNSMSSTEWESTLSALPLSWGQTAAAVTHTEQIGSRDAKTVLTRKLGQRSRRLQHIQQLKECHLQWHLFLNRLSPDSLHNHNNWQLKLGALWFTFWCTNFSSTCISTMIMIILLHSYGFQFVDWKKRRASSYNHDPYTHCDFGLSMTKVTIKIY